MSLDDVPTLSTRHELFGRLKGRIRDIWANPIVRRAVQLVWGVAVAFFVGHYVWRNWSSFSTYDWRFDLRWALVAAAWAMTRRLLAGIRWLFIEFLDWNQLQWNRILDHLGVYFTSNLARYIPGSLWYMASRIKLSSERGFSSFRTSMALVYEIVLNVLSGCAIGSYAGAVFFSLGDLRFAFFGLCFVGLTVLVSHPKPTSLVLGYASRVLGRGPYGIDVASGLGLRSWSLSIAVWIFGGLSQFCLLRAFHPTLSLNHIAGITSATALAWTIGFLVPWAPQGLGVRDGLLVWLLGSYAPAPALVIVTIASRLVTVFEDLAWSAISLVVSRR